MREHLPWRQWLPDFLLLALMWGSSFLFMRVGAREFGPSATAFVRVLLGALVLTPLLLWRGQAGLLRGHGWHLLIAGGFNSALPFACYGYALLTIGTGLASILNATTPLFAAIIARLWLGERLPAARATGLLLGFAGVTALTAGASGGISLDAGGSGLAALVCLVATLSYGFSSSFITRYLQHLPTMAIACGSLWGASALLLPVAALSWPATPPSWQAWGAIAMTGVFSTALAYVLFFRLIARTGPARAMTVTYLVPVTANLLGVLVLGETVTLWMLGCGLVIVLGTALASGLLGPRPKADA